CNARDGIRGAIQDAIKSGIVVTACSLTMPRHEERPTCAASLGRPVPGEHAKQFHLRSRRRFPIALSQRLPPPPDLAGSGRSDADCQDAHSLPSTTSWRFGLRGMWSNVIVQTQGLPPE